MKIVILAIFVLAISSCGPRGTGRAPSSLLGSEALEVKALGAAQKSVATNLCFELKSKNMMWRSNLLSSNFNFDVEEKSCGQSALPVRTVSSTLRAQYNSDPMRFDPSAGQTLPAMYVGTDVHGSISSLCQKLFNGESVSNTMNYSEGRIQFLFHQNSVDGFDGYTQLYFKEGESTSFKEVVTEFELNSSKLPSADHRGLERVVRMRENCPDSSSQAYFIQTYLP